MNRERHVIALRITPRWVLDRIAASVRLARSPVGWFVNCYGVPASDHVDDGTALRARRAVHVRYELTSPPELVYVDFKKPGEFPDGRLASARMRRDLVQARGCRS